MHFSLLIWYCRKLCCCKVFCKMFFEPLCFLIFLVISQNTFKFSFFHSVFFITICSSCPYFIIKFWAFEFWIAIWWFISFWSFYLIKGCVNRANFDFLFSIYKIVLPLYYWHFLMRPSFEHVCLLFLQCWHQFEALKLIQGWNAINPNLFSTPTFGIKVMLFSSFFIPMSLLKYTFYRWL